jgi:altronate hydrolase
MTEFIRIHPLDNVAVALKSVPAGTEFCGITALCEIQQGHKMALRHLNAGEMLIKYGFPIGQATDIISPGEWVHSHNVKTNLKGNIEYSYEPKFYDIDEETKVPTFLGYVRKNGEVGIRNEVWIVNTVGCVNKCAQKIAEKTGARYFPHPFGCSQLGDDQVITQKILKCT